MNKNYSELIEYLDKKFQETARKEDLKELTSGLVTLEEFDGLRKEVNERFDKLDRRLDLLINSIDKLTKAIKDYHQEQIALSAKVDRHEKWIQQIAKKVGVELKT